MAKWEAMCLDVRCSPLSGSIAVDVSILRMCPGGDPRRSATGSVAKIAGCWRRGSCWNRSRHCAVDRLLDFARGCDWLLDQWEELGETLAEGNSLTFEQKQLAARMLGIADEDNDEDDRAVRLDLLSAGGRGPVDFAEVDRFLSLDTTSLSPEDRCATINSWLPDAEKVRQSIATLIAEEFAASPRTAHLSGKTPTARSWRPRSALTSFDATQEGTLPPALPIDQLA